MVNIEIDEDVFNHLKSLAEPFIDTPNTVLRRLLFQEQQHKSETSTKGVPSEYFTRTYLKNRYGEPFHTKTPFRTMLESEKHLVYFQNFNKSGTDNLWYRLSESSLRALRTTNKIALVCFTNPSENVIIEVPMKEIDIQVGRSSWKKEFLEVNIDPTSFRWRELDWSLRHYVVKNEPEEAK